MHTLIFAASMLAIITSAVPLSGCLSGQGQQSLIGSSHDWSRANSVPAGMVGGIIRAGGPRRK